MIAFTISSSSIDCQPTGRSFKLLIASKSPGIVTAGDNAFCACKANPEHHRVQREKLATIVLA